MTAIVVTVHVCLHEVSVYVIIEGVSQVKAGMRAVMCVGVCVTVILQITAKSGEALVGITAQSAMLVLKRRVHIVA